MILVRSSIFVIKEPENCVERRLVLVAHDESTSQANDGLTYVLQVTNVVPLFEQPNCVVELFFDQSSAHGAHANNAHNANEMNVKPGGNQ